MRFPELCTCTLDAHPFKLPHDLPGVYNLIFIHHEPWQFIQSETWRPFIDRLEDEFPQFFCYSLFLTGNGYLSPPQTVFFERDLEPTQTLLPTESVKLIRQTLGFDDEREIDVMLIELNGIVVWRDVGNWSHNKAESLDDYLLSKLTLQDGFK